MLEKASKWQQLAAAPQTRTTSRKAVEVYLSWVRLLHAILSIQAAKVPRMNC